MAKKAKSKKRRKKSRTETINSVVGAEKINGIDLYKVESALDAMTRANEVKKDEKLMKATDKLLQRRQDAMNQVAKQIRN